MLGTRDHQAELLDSQTVCGHLVSEDSIYRKLAEIGDRLFTDEDFADMYDPKKGRHSIPPSLLAKVLLLQSLEGTSDREACDRVRCDLRWKVALDLPLQDEGFHPTGLTYFRERLRNSEKPRRIFDRFKQVATEAGLLSRRGTRVLDSTPVLSAVQTQDTVALIKGAIRRLLALISKADPETKAAIEEALQRDDYATSGKPAIDWDDEAQRNELVDQLVQDALKTLQLLEGKELEKEVAEASELLATVAGQDVEQGEDGKFHIVKGVAKDRVISVVDPEARHGHKSQSGGFAGYKAHIAIDPETEIITEVEVTAANVNDEGPIEELLPELKEEDEEEEEKDLTVVADSAYGAGRTREMLLQAGAKTVIKAQQPNNSTGKFPKSEFQIDLENETVTCPAGETAQLYTKRSSGEMQFLFAAEVCAVCHLRDQCTSSPKGRMIVVGPYEAILSEARAEQKTDEFKNVYNSKRPTVERVISRVVRKGGRKARYRGLAKVSEQMGLKASAENLLRMLRLGLTWTAEGIGATS